MLHKAYCGLSLVVVGLMGSLADGQTINIDYGGLAGSPWASYKAAGWPGVWNILNPEHGVAESLYRVDDTPVAATVTLLDGAGALISSVDDPGTTLNEEWLLDDFAHGGTDVVGTIRFDNLENDTYEVIVYAWTPGSPDVLTSVWPDCDMSGEPFLVGGPWPGQLEEGVTHARFTTTVTDGTLLICTGGGLTWDGAINGIQLVGTDCLYNGPIACRLGPDRGDCDGICPMYFHNPCTGQCELFYWGCCGGNENKFETLEECEIWCPSDPSACQFENPLQGDPGTPDLGYGTKNRYLSIRPPDAPGPCAIRVRITSLPGFEYAEGRTMWVQHPWAITEWSGSVGLFPQPTFWAAGLGCDPAYTYWDGYNMIDIWDDAIIPGGIYEVQMIKEECSPINPDNFSGALTVVASATGDVAGDCVEASFTSPQGVVDFVDIAALVEKFKNAPGALRKARADLISTDIARPAPDWKVDFADITYCVDAFRSQASPLAGPPIEDPCGGP